MRRFLAVGATAALCLSGALASSAAAAPNGSNPKAVCDELAMLDPDTYAFLGGTTGTCVSSLASVGMEELMAGAFPSTAAAIANCKFLEENVFVEFGGYPYAFYGQVDDERFVAKNRAGCVEVLYRLHTGEITPPPPPPMP